MNEWNEKINEMKKKMTEKLKIIKAHYSILYCKTIPYQHWSSDSELLIFRQMNWWMVSIILLAEWIFSDHVPVCLEVVFAQVLEKPSIAFNVKIK